MDILVVVDMQNDFITGAKGSAEAMAIVPRVVRKMEAFSGRVICTRDTYEDGYMKTQECRKLPVPVCIRGTAGWLLHSDVEAVRKELPIDKKTLASVELGSLLRTQDQELRGKGEKIASVTLVGLNTDNCVVSNALLLKAFLPEAEVIVDASCCVGETAEGHAHALAVLTACQVRVENA